MSDDEDKVKLGPGKAKHETEKALLVKLYDHAERGELWIPKSQIDEDSEVFEKGNEGEVIVTRWWAQRNEFR